LFSSISFNFLPLFTGKALHCEQGGPRKVDPPIVPLDRQHSQKIRHSHQLTGAFHQQIRDSHQLINRRGSHQLIGGSQQLIGGSHAILRPHQQARK
jgi:hypothetical protein